MQDAAVASGRCSKTARRLTPPEALCNMNVKMLLYRAEHVVTKQLRSESGEPCCLGKHLRRSFITAEVSILCNNCHKRSLTEVSANVTQCNCEHIEHVC